MAQDLVVLTEEQLKECEEAEKRVKASMGKMERGFLVMCPDVAKINAYQGYLYKGYKSMEKYASEVLGMGRTTMYSLLLINERFGNENYQIKEEYKDLTFTQLNAIARIPYELEQKLPEGWRKMTVSQLNKEIKALKGIESKETKAKDSKNVSRETPDGDSGAETSVYSFDAVSKAAWVTADMLHDLYNTIYNTMLKDKYVTEETEVTITIQVEKN